ncbi:MAG: transcriptional regulator [Terriglobales bacterium]
MSDRDTNCSGFFVALVFLLALVVCPWAAAQWVTLGPDGGDVRSLAYDPHNPDRLFLGTSAGQLFLSNDNGASWSRLARLGSGNDLVLDNIEADPKSGALYVAAWSIETDGGGLFRSDDSGKSWRALPGVHGKSIRALALAPSDGRIVIIGALDGVWRSTDAGKNWERISPLNHAEIRNIESVAIDPHDPNIVYAGTWHLAWKTEDGGRSWHSIKRGVIDDSDVFSIIVDYNNRQNVYLSACSGIYKSENSADLFHKIQGIPFSARRTRVLKQDPINPAIVYAGTTEGLWRTLDAGKTWQRITAANIIVNDVHVDPRNASRVLIATDRSGVLASTDAGRTFVASNRGFAHRQVASVLVDRFDPRTVYAGVVNDKEFGGVFVSRDGGQNWRQVNSGINKLDIFTLGQTESGSLLAGTNKGVFELPRNASDWRALNVVLTEKVVPAPKVVRAKSSKKKAPPAPPKIQWVRSELNARVSQLHVSPGKWFAATSNGLYHSQDGKSWRGGAVLGERDFRSVNASGDVVLATTARSLVLSRDGGVTWARVRLPIYVTVVYSGIVTPENVLWLATREGAVRSRDLGVTWEHVLDGLPPKQLVTFAHDSQARRMMAVTSNGELFTSKDNGKSWHKRDAGFHVRNFAFTPGRVFATTAFDGVIAEGEARESQVGGGGGN